MDKPIKILFLAANPKDTSPLRLDEEIRGIDQALRQSEFRDKFDIKQHWAVRVTDLQSYFLRYKPDIVHFSGHGSESSEIILEDNDGNSQSVSNRALSQLFSVLKDNIRCVVLNACYSEQQAQAIAKNIDCVIGMSKLIGDSATISFAVAFYQALGYGKDVKTAFELGRAQIDLEGLNEQDTPKLLAINNNPEEMVFVNDLLNSGNHQKANTNDTTIKSSPRSHAWFHKFRIYPKSVLGIFLATGIVLAVVVFGISKILNMRQLDSEFKSTIRELSKRMQAAPRQIAESYANTKPSNVRFQKMENDSLHVVIESAHTGDSYRFFIPRRASLKWSLKTICDNFGLANTADIGLPEKYTVRWVIVDKRVEDIWNSLPHSEQERVKALIGPKDSLRTIYSDSEPLENLNITDHTVFHLYAIILDDGGKVRYAVKG